MSSSNDDPFRPPSDDDRSDQQYGQQPDQQPGQRSGWGWGQEPQDPARASWEASRQQPTQGPPQGPPQQQWWDQSGQQPQQGQPQGGYGPPGAYGAPAGGYGVAPAGAYGGYGSPQFVADHPRSTTALVAGLISLIGGLMCGLPLLAAPYALVVGRRAVKEIDAEPGRYGGRGAAMTGYVMGIIGTVLLALGVIGIVLFIIAVASTGFA